MPLALALIVLLAVLAIFQLALVFGAPIGRFTWGGKHRVLRVGLRIGSVVSILTDAVRWATACSRRRSETRRRLSEDVITREGNSPHDLGEGHPLLGRRMPDIDLDTADGQIRVFTLLHDAKPVLLNLVEPASLHITPWADRVRLVDARSTGAWRLPVLGEVTHPTAVLIRPDGYVAWVGQGTDHGLTDALTFWFAPGLSVR